MPLVRSPSEGSSSSHTSTLRDSDAFSIELEGSVESASTSTTVCTSRSRRSMEKLKTLDVDVDMHIVKPEPLVRREDIGFAKTRRISYDDDKTAAPPLSPPPPPPYSSTRTKTARDHETNEHEHGYEHEHESEPRTLPMYLFFLGFRTFTLRLPHTDSERRPGGRLDPFRMWSLPADEKAEAEREVERLIRRWEVEWRWGKRCMWATVGFVGVGLVAGMAVWGALRR
ncbi:hypothetical protein C0995_011598 [Termitomyces sp. Mi166|nr:hypothetical protein C0995_011598 [Termitomyces sp. Mi166\